MGWCDAPDSDEGSRQDDCDGRSHGRRSPQGGCDGPRQGHQWHGWEGCAVSVRLRSNQFRFGEGHCVGTHQQGHGCLQCDERCHRELPCPQLLVLVSEPPRCAGSIQCSPRVQGCGESRTMRELTCRRTSTCGRGVQGVLDVKSACPGCTATKECSIPCMICQSPSVRQK